MLSDIDQQLHELILDINLLYLDANKDILSKHGMRQARYFAMRHLYLEPKLSLGQLSRLTLVDRASMSRMIRSMEKDDLVFREPSEKDRRLFRLSLTEAGRAFFKTIQSDLNMDIQKRFENLDSKLKVDLLDLNLKLKDALEGHTQSEQG